MLSIRHHSLFTPRDFDLSPYFSVVNPTIENRPDYKSFEWRAALLSERMTGPEALKENVETDEAPSHET